MKRKTLGAVVAFAVVFGSAQMVFAQGGPGGEFHPGGPEHHEGFGGPEGPGMMGGGRGCIATSSTPCPEYQFTFTITNTEPVLVSGTASTITNITTGTLAADAHGSTYRDIKVSGKGRFAPPGGSAELIFIRDLDPSVLMNYFVNVTKGTYEASAIHPHTPPANWNGKGPDKGPRPDNRPTPTAITNYKISDGSYTCPSAEQFSSSRTIQLPGGESATITRNSVFCVTLKLRVEEDGSDPRFGTSTYQLSGYMATAHVSFSPPFGLSPAPTLVQSKHPMDDHERRDRGPRPPTP